MTRPRTILSMMSRKVPGDIPSEIRKPRISFVMFSVGERNLVRSIIILYDTIIITMYGLYGLALKIENNANMDTRFLFLMTFDCIAQIQGCIYKCVDK